MGKRKKPKAKIRKSPRKKPASRAREKPATGSYADWIPPSWIKDGASEVWIRCYRIARLGPDALPTTKSFDFGLVRVVIHGGTLTYLHLADASGLDKTGEAFAVYGDRIREPSSPEGAYLILLTPFDEAGQLQTDVGARERIEWTAGLLTAALGHNITYRPIFDNSMEVPARHLVVSSDLQLAPQLYDPPNVSDEGLASANTLHVAVEALSTERQARVRLSLRWYAKALQDVQGADSLLNLWIALETLVLEDDTNIAPIKNAIGRTYGITPGQASDRFGIGQIYDLRGKLVHHGDEPPIGPPHIKYFDALYRDVLLDFLGQPKELHLDEVLADPELDVRDLIRLPGTGKPKGS